MEDNQRVSIENVEDFRGEGDMKFSHQALVMKSMNRVIELGSKELKEGFLDYNAVDSKGNIKPVYSEDTRRTFIESIKTCEMVMICDYDSDAITNIKNIHKKIVEKRNELLQTQKTFYESRNHEFKKKHPTDFNYFNIEFSYYNFFLELQIDLFREIFAELSLLTKRIGFYEEGEFHA